MTLLEEQAAGCNYKHGGRKLEDRLAEATDFLTPEYKIAQVRKGGPKHANTRSHCVTEAVRVCFADPGSTRTLTF